MKHRGFIGIRISHRAFHFLEEPLVLGELPNRFNITERFNPRHTHIFAIATDDYEGEVKIGLAHPEFRHVPDTEYIPEYRLDEIRKCFPFLFELEEPTNPILWRNFGFGSSH